MPMYEYACSCGKRFEKLRPMSAGKGDKQSCPACGKPAPRALSVFTATSDSKPAGGGRGDHLPTCGTCGVPGGPCAMN